MSLVLIKDIPSTSDFYTGGGDDTTITIIGIDGINIQSKKKLIKINIPKTKNKQTSNPSDNFTNNVVDLKQGSDQIQIDCVLEDDGTDTAWNKFWKLRAMCTSGGGLKSLTIADKTFNSSSQEVFLESVTCKITPDDTGVLNVSAGSDVVRISVSLELFVGTSRG